MLALLKKTLRCSFCGKTDKEVARLRRRTVVHICDGCVGACNKILEATPSTNAGWDRMTDEQLLGWAQDRGGHGGGDTRRASGDGRKAEAAQGELGDDRQDARHLAAGRVGALS